MSTTVGVELDEAVDLAAEVPCQACTRCARLATEPHKGPCDTGCSAPATWRMVIVAHTGCDTRFRRRTWCDKHRGVYASSAVCGDCLQEVLITWERL